MRTISIIILTVLIYSSALGQNKTEFEKGGVKVKFTNTKLGEIVNTDFKLIKEMNLEGYFIFLPKKNAVVLRHNNGNDELLKVISSKKTPDKNYIFVCDKQRVLFISPTSSLVTYSIEGNSSVFVFPIDSNDIEKLKLTVSEY